MVQFLKNLISGNKHKKVKNKKEPACVTEEKKLRARKEALFLLRGVRYSVFAKCAHCSFIFPEVEVLREFSKNRQKYFVFLTCSECGGRVTPMLKGDSDSLCGLKSQFATLSSLRNENLEKMEPKVICDDYTSVYHSTIFHYGSLKNAFNMVGKKYVYEEIPDWENRIGPLVGRFSNSLISKMSGVSEKKIRSFSTSC